jgi:mobilization protein NikA
MGTEQSTGKRGRPSDTGVVRNRQFSFPVSEDERKMVADAAAASGMSLTSFLRDAALAAAGRPIHTPVPLAKTGKVITHTGNSELPIQIIPSVVPENAERKQQFAPPARTRAGAHADARTQNKREEKEDLGVSSSLRSSQALPVAEPDSEVPWANPAPLKLSIKLSTGEVVVNTWLFANGCRIPGPDVIRLLESSTYKPLRKAMLQCFARSLRDTYRMKWCSAYNRRMNAWQDTPRSNNAFLRAAEVLARQYAERGMSVGTFIDACDEMRPKTVRFVPVDMLGGAIGARVADWIPPEQRDHAKLGDSHVDTSGQQWIVPHGESQAIPVLRTAADRERFLKTHKVAR